MLVLVTVVLGLLFKSTHEAADPQWPRPLQELQGCTRNVPLGMATGEIQATQISASSNYPPDWDKGCADRFGRLYQPNGLGWCAKYKSASEWLQVDLGVPAKVTGVMTQGRGDGAEWVTSLLVSYSLDGYNWLYVTDTYGNKRVFEGNTDSYSVKHSYLDDTIILRYIKFHTSTWHRHPSMRVEVIGCQVCRERIALPPYGKALASSEKLNDSASSCHAEDGFLITNKAWCAQRNNVDQWLQLDVGPPTVVTGLVTRGRNDAGRKQWVTKYTILFSNDSNIWNSYKDSNQQDIKAFTGNINSDEEIVHYLESPFTARFVRYHPLEWHRHISMRAGLIGCPYNGPCSTGFLKVNENAPCVENLAYHKESFVNNRRQYKRHASSVERTWIRGHASRVVDGSIERTMHSCTVLDNFYVERPVWMVDLARKTTVSGVVIVTWTNAHTTDVRTSQQDYMLNLEKLAVYVDSAGGREDIDQPANMCGIRTRMNDAPFSSRLHIQCARPMKGRYVYIEAWGLQNRGSRLFGAVLCEVMVYQ